MNTDAPLRDIMTTELHTVGPNENVNTIKLIFNKYPIRHIPVVDNQKRLLGIISKEDFLRLTYTMSLQTTGPTFTGKWYEGLTVGELMTKSPIDLDPEDTIGLAADVFMTNDFHAIPIVENGTLVGIVTTFDLLRYAFEKQEDII